MRCKVRFCRRIFFLTSGCANNTEITEVINVLEKLLMVQEKINGEEAEAFKVGAFGKYLSADVTLVFDEQPYSISFHKGKNHRYS